MERRSLRERRQKKIYVGTMPQKILLGKTISITLADGRVFKIVNVRRVLQSVKGGTIMMDSGDKRRFRLKVLSNEKPGDDAA